ncbi:MAG: hypothetical protein WC681_16380, partial [Sterolibacterium sp.]
MNKLNALLAAVVLFTSTAAYPEDNPIYNDNGVLTIPRVDTAGQVGQYQDVVFQYVSQGNWTISSGQILGTGRLERPGVVTQVAVIKSGTLPVNVYLRADGYRPNGCPYSGLARIHQRQVGSLFDVGISALSMSDSADTTCGASIMPFKVTIPLQVYGLSAGTYTYSVNGVTGTLTLASA